MELVSALTRIENSKIADRVFHYTNETFLILEEYEIFDRVISIAWKTGCSGFDTYILASASLHSCSLFTDDAHMHSYAKQGGIQLHLLENHRLKPCVLFHKFVFLLKVSPSGIAAIISFMTGNTPCGVF